MYGVEKFFNSIVIGCCLIFLKINCCVFLVIFNIEFCGWLLIIRGSDCFILFKSLIVNGICNKVLLGWLLGVNCLMLSVKVCFCLL